MDGGWVTSAAAFRCACRMRRSVIVGWLALALPLSACAALSRGTVPGTPGQDVIPWIDAKPAGLDQGLATPVSSTPPRECRDSDLRASSSTYDVKDDELTLGVQLMNQSGSDCVVAGVPMVILLAEAGPIALTQTTLGAVRPTPVVMSPLIPSVGPDQAEAQLVVSWRMADAGSSACSAGVAAATAIQLLLPGQSEPIRVEAFADKGNTPVPVCPPYLGVEPFQASAIPPGAILTPQYWKATLHIPTSAEPGSSLDYQVTLENVYYRPLEFHNGCPGYIEALAGPGDWTTGKVWFALNCRAIGMVAPGASVLFAMRMAVPSNAPAGSSTLIWELNNGPTSYGASLARLTIAAG
jgi:uncharacterized protein DUF4232